MKKVISVALVIILALSSVFALSGCGNKSGITIAVPLVILSE